MLAATTLLTATLLSPTTGRHLAIPRQSQVCVSAYIDGSLLGLPPGKGFDASLEFASRLEQLYLRDGGKPPAVAAGVPAAKFNGELGRDTGCDAARTFKIMLQYNRLPSGQPYLCSYTITVDRKTVAGTIKQDLSQRPGLKDGLLEAPWSPLADIINKEMTDHARTVLSRLKL